MLLLEARTALAWSELSVEEKGMVNGWVKALVRFVLQLCDYQY
jgi:hypothetical protein